MGNRTRIIVKFCKEFTYPLPMLLKDTPYRDAENKAWSDFRQELTDSYIKRGEIDYHYFKIESIKELPFKLRKSLDVEDPKLRRLDLREAIDALTKSYMREKYGEIDHEINPDLFVHQDAQFMDDNGQNIMVKEEGWYLKPEVEIEYKVKKQYFLNILRNIL